jgi:hypothetical protein
MSLRYVVLSCLLSPSSPYLRFIPETWNLHPRPSLFHSTWDQSNQNLTDSYCSFHSQHFTARYALPARSFAPWFIHWNRSLSLLSPFFKFFPSTYGFPSHSCSPSDSQYPSDPFLVFQVLHLTTYPSLYPFLIPCYQNRSKLLWNETKHWSIAFLPVLRYFLIGFSYCFTPTQSWTIRSPNPISSSRHPRHITYDFSNVLLEWHESILSSHSIWLCISSLGFASFCFRF